MQWLSYRKWVVVVRTLNWKERALFSVLAGIAAGAFVFWLGAMYFSLTQPVAAVGGLYTEGIMGQPVYVNPLFSQVHDADADISELVYSGLFDYDAQGRLRPSLAEGYEISEDGKRYTMKLRQNAQWHDGKRLDANDAVFTFKIIQDPSYKSPLRPNFQGVEVRKVDDFTLSFDLKKPYFGFLESLSVGILPKHIWENIPPEKFMLNEYNLAPVGSGPYQYYDLKKDSNGNILSYELRAFPGYFEHFPYISKILFRFYPSEDALIEAYNRREVMGMSNVTPEKEPSLEDRKSTKVYELRRPRLFAVFFNETKSVSLANKEVRRALSRATDRQAFVDEVFKGKALPLYGPFLPQMEGYVDLKDQLGFDIDQSRQILEADGWVRKDGTWEKNGTRLAFTLTVPEWPELVKTAEVLKSQWEKAGAQVTVNVLGVTDFQQNAVKPQQYEALLFGEETNTFTPDLYSFWHSSQKNESGLNFSRFDNKDADTLLSDARETLNTDDRNKKYAEFQRIFSEQSPAVFLYSPSYLYVVNNRVQGVHLENISMPSKRFSGIEDWYVKTKRILKD